MALPPSGGWAPVRAWARVVRLPGVPLRALVVFIALSACTPRSDGAAAGGERGASTAPPSVCTSVGQRCLWSPGKLGTCVKKDDCTENCFTCQSQH